LADRGIGLARGDEAVVCYKTQIVKELKLMGERPVGFHEGTARGG
jgi:hypothetical protein